MDTSKTYIEQCEKAGEIQRGKHYPVTTGQRIIFWENDVFAQINLLSINWKIVWLPRQDQLQELLYEINNDFSQPNIKYGITYVGCPNCIVKDLSKFSEQDCSLNLTSMEQLWLAFVMKEKYQKSWNGSEWVSLPLTDK